MSAWEPISAILHKITKQCSCLLLQQRMHPTSVYSHTRMLVCHSTHSLLSAGNKYRPPSCAMSSGTRSLHRSLHNITFWEKLPLPDDTVPTTLSFTYSLNYILGRKFQCIRSLPHCIYISSSTCHEISHNKLCKSDTVPLQLFEWHYFT